MKHVDRRSFLATMGGAALALAGCSQSVAALAGSPARKRLARIGIQLYSVRRQATADLTGTLQQLATIGFREIEFWGSHSLTPAQIRGVLDANGLTSPSVHVGLPSSAEAWPKIFADAKTMGHKWITVPSLPSGPKATVADWKALATRFNEAGRRCADMGYRFAFHNHNTEFRRIGSTTAVPVTDPSVSTGFDVLLSDTDPALVSFELDLHWAIAGGVDPVTYLQRHPKRFTMVHVKDSAGAPDFRQTDVGAGSYPWKTLIAECDRQGVQHYFIEHDSPADPMAFARQSHDFLKTLEF